jgi:hypothetical protein
VTSATKKKSTMMTYQLRSGSMEPLIIMTPEDDLSGIIPSIQHAPKICVDYLSHEWTKEDDIWTSWKVMSKQKNELANGKRLENASWRTWVKQKYNLKTVNPQKLNWLKDSDVTWLYGPLHTAWSNHFEISPESQTTEDKLNLLPSSTKSCLKKKSMSEILRPIVKGRYGSLVSSNSDTQLYKKEEEQDDYLDTNDYLDNYLDTSDCETSSTCSSISGPTTPTTTNFFPFEKNVNRKIQFNDRVEQCIAVESDENVDDLLHDSDSSSSDDEILIMKSSPKKKPKDLSTIFKLAPTKLKEDRICNNEYSSLYSSSRRRANSSNSSSSTTTQSQSTSSSSSSTTTPHQPWMDDDDDLELDLIDFDTAIPQHPPYQQAEAIIPPPNSIFEDNDEDVDDEDDDFIERAVNIANGIREIVHWFLKGRIF